MILVFALALLGSCVKQSATDDPKDTWNGYDKYLKYGEQYHTLFAGRYINVGECTYGLIDLNGVGHFYVTYNLTGGWTMSEAHMYAGTKLNLPRTKPDTGNPKVGRFPHHGYFNPRVTTHTFYVPLTSLPPCQLPGFVVASHCVVRSSTNQNETAWAEGDIKFTDKDWGWYDIFYFNQPPNEYTILYGTKYSNGQFYLYHINMTTNVSEMIFSETVGDNSGSYDGAAFDEESNTFFFVNYTTGVLYMNATDDLGQSVPCGTLTGTAASATFYNGAYYYVDGTTNAIKRANFDSNYQMQSISTLSTIPTQIEVTDIAMNETGTLMYILGDVSDQYGNVTGSQLIQWDVLNNTYQIKANYTVSGGQLAFGSDGVLYAIAEDPGHGPGSSAFIVDTQTGSWTVIEDGGIDIEDPFSDISGGRTI